MLNLPFFNEKVRQNSRFLPSSNPDQGYSYNTINCHHHSLSSPFPQTLSSKRSTIYGFNQRAKPQTVQRKEYKHRSFELPAPTPHFLEDERNMVKLDKHVVLGDALPAISTSPSSFSPPIPSKSPYRVATVNAIRILECKKRYLSNILPEPVEVPIPACKPKELHPALEPKPIMVKSSINDRLVRELSRRRESSIRHINDSPPNEDHDFQLNQDAEYEQPASFLIDPPTLYSNSRYSGLSESTTELSFSSTEDMDSLIDLYDVTMGSLQFTNGIESVPDFDFTPIAPLAIPSMSYLGQIDQIEREIQNQLASMYANNSSNSDDDSTEENQHSISASLFDSVYELNNETYSRANHPRGLLPLFSANTPDNMNQSLISFS